MLKLKLHCSVFIRLMATAVSAKTTSLIVAIDEAAQLDAHCWSERPECDTSTCRNALALRLRHQVRSCAGLLGLVAFMLRTILDASNASYELDANGKVGLKLIMV